MIRLFRVSIPITVVVLVLSDMVLIAGCYVLAAMFALDALVDPWFYLRYDNGWLQVAFVVGVIQAGFYFLDLYDDLRIRSRILLLHQLCLLLGVSFLMQALVGYSESTLLQLPQWTMVYGSLLVLLAVPAWRWTFFSIVQKALPDHRILFLGLSPAAQEISEYLEDRPDTGFIVSGYLDKQPGPTRAEYLGGFDDLDSILSTKRPEILAVDRNHLDPEWLAGHNLLSVRASGAKVEDLSLLYEMVFGRVSLRDLKPAEMLFGDDRLREWALRFQDLYSLLLALVGLILTLPVMALVWVAVKVSSPGPAVYSQLRMGRNGSTFNLYKFRSMYVNAETRSGPVWASKNDPRITPLGRWLRKLRLDELPQFFNVLRGDMALVGPRPERPEFCAVLEQKIPYYHLRHSVKPGITGWAQINHPYTETVEDTARKLEYDLYYVKHLAPALDAYIIFHTFKVMLLFRGAQ